MVVLKAEQWRRIGHSLFVAAGASERNAARVTASLVDASLAGHDSHGVIRFIQYTRAIEAGQLDPASEPVIVKETSTSSLIDGKWTFGQVSAELAMKKAIQQARSYGIAIVGLFKAYHIGRLGEYSDMANEAGMVGMVFGGGFGGAGGSGKPSVAPYGGARGALGTNPISFGVPAGDLPPIMLDIATSAVAGGKISLARAKHEPLPPNCILDRYGNPSTDPEDFYADGTLLPFGGYKGYGLSVVIELLAPALTGSDECAEPKLGGGTHTRAGSVFIAINPSIFRSFEGYAAAVGEKIKRIKSVPPAQGFEEVLLPGEPERRTREKRLIEGVSLPDDSWRSLRDLGSKYGLDVPTLMG